MGNSESAPVLSKKDIKDLMGYTPFGEQEIKNLFDSFTRFAKFDADAKEYVMSLSVFKEVMGLDDGPLSTRVFSVLDADKSGALDFREYAIGVGFFRQGGSQMDKLKFAFRIFDIDGDGTIERSELGELVAASAMQHGVKMKPKAVEEAVDAFFSLSDGDGDGGITFAEFQKLNAKHPEILEALSVVPEAKK
ncbi:Calcineurin B protein like protein [Aduncisulcus paluster]|uniref:Calcineurin B protein like protein n=1 Tax=Aduncisulcus paluster TaxID=2918883 RepID=A0ABQ5K3Z5_9EUKA|nr:Calcineurin B protein like protein [Aduncisulcus paluster]|eukprot:gnl/Carplike_NY0171/5789_a7937_295.p1 GENE.gnl/Carplike_NY0171/5789_a7937_295~~gnl/Carplike_NY0171/5789_a7937_295.p1  ORF type:complete len:192 (+),score=64.70 gnl/Carplike_NY0171/5789_a7937_295:12-587(+)